MTRRRETVEAIRSVQDDAPIRPDPQKQYFIPLGLVVYARQDNAPWVYVGYRVTSVGSRSHHFVRMLQMSRVPPYMYHYMATREATLKKKFEGLP